MCARQQPDRSKMLGLGVLLCALLLSGSTAATNPLSAASAMLPPDTSAANAAKWEIRNLVQQFVKAWNNNDIDALTSLFTKNGSFVSPTGADAQGRHEINELLTEEHRKMFRGTTLNTDIENIDLHSEDAAAEAVASGTYTLKNVDVALWVEVAVEGTFTFEFTRNSGQWFITTARIAR